MEDLKKIGKYELHEYLGGGMSHVFKAWDPVMERVVVVKIMTRQASADPDAKARFLREAKTAGAIAHDNVIRIYDFGEEYGRPYMVMEFLEGSDLKDAMRSSPPGGIRRWIEIAGDAAKALEHIHEHSIVHRDIKPENIHLDKNGRVRLMDFGIAKRQEMSLTKTGMTMGTPYYMPPEQVRAADVDHRADIYSFGVMLYEMFSGKRPFGGDTLEQVFYRIMHEPVPMEPLRGMVPRSLCDLIERSTAKDPAARPQSMTEVRQVLEAALDEELGEAAPTIPMPGRSEPESGVAPEEDRRKTPPPEDEGGGLGILKWLIPGIAAVALIIIGVVYFATRPAPVEPVEPGPAPRAEIAPSFSTPTGEMLLVPAGEFFFGEDLVSRRLPAFYMDRTEVTNAAWAQFCDATGRPLPPDFPRDRPELPVVNITFSEAEEFAQWAGKRLPNELEWEKAARAGDGRPYPWGQDRDITRVASAGNEAVSGIRPADDFPDGASPFGIIQMAGNVWEFVDEKIQPSEQAMSVFAGLLSPPPTPDEEWRTIRGGAFDTPLIENVTREWGAVPVRFKAHNIGFRCVKPAQ